MEGWEDGRMGGRDGGMGGGGREGWGEEGGREGGRRGRERGITHGTISPEVAYLKVCLSSIHPPYFPLSEVQSFSCVLYPYLIMACTWRPHPHLTPSLVSR